MDHQRRLLCMALAGAGIVPAAHAQGASKRTPSGKGFEEPATAQEYVATMRLGSQAGDYLEMAYEPAARSNAVGAAEFDIMRNEGGFDHVRIPAICSARANLSGQISETFLQKLDEQIDLALARFERVVVDPLHHYLQWKGEHRYDKFSEDFEAVGQLTAEQHAARATVMWVQLARRYRDKSLRLSFDLFNEPGAGKPQDHFPPGLNADQLNDWHAAVIPAIRETGGKNAQRMIWLEPFANQIALLTIPPNAGVLGVSPHYYSPFGFTHRDADLTAAGLANFTEDILYAKRWGEEKGLPIWVGEVGVSKTLQPSKAPRSDADRAEYLAHVRTTGLATGIPMCYWSFGSAFALYDQKSGHWMPNIRQAVSGLPQPYPVRAIPSFNALKGGRIARPFFANSTWPGFRWDAASGTLTAEANNTGKPLYLNLVFPDVRVESGQSWIVRATEFTGTWLIGAAPFAYDPERPDSSGRRGLDIRATNDKGQAIYPDWRASAPGGFDNPFRTIAMSNTFLSVDVGLPPGSPAGRVRFACLRST